MAAVTLADLGAVETAYRVTHVDVPAVEWVRTHQRARDELGYDYFDWLSAYDDGPAGLAVVTHLWSVAARAGVLLRTRVPREEPRLASVTGVFRGADWHERETYEMFGIGFDGHPRLAPLLLPPGFEGHPLRKEFVLAARAVADWPGAKEPGESGAPAASRRRTRPPGVPDPDWGSAWR